MKKFQRPIIINAVIVSLLLLLCVLFPEQQRKGNVLIPGSMISGLGILFLSVVNFVIGVIHNRDRKGDGQYYFLFAGVLLLIGFSVCSYSS